MGTLAPTKPPTPPPTPCVHCHSLNFANSEVKENNLGGTNMRFHNVAVEKGHILDLVLTNKSNYVGDTGSEKVNGKYGKLGNVNLQVGSNVTIEFKFESGDGDLFTVPCFYFSVFDIDRAGKNVGKESVIAYGISQGNAWLSPNSDLEIQNDTQWEDSLFIKPKIFGSKCDNPVDPENLVVESCFNQEKNKNQDFDQKDFVVKFKYEKVNTFKMTFRASPNDNGGADAQSRNILFAGNAPQVGPTENQKECIDVTTAPTRPPTAPPTAPPTPPCVKCDVLDFESATMGDNGLGTSRMKFQGVTKVDGASVDLVLTNTSNYVGDTADEKVNGKYGKLGNVNLQVGSNVSIDFKFVDADEAEVTLPCFYFSVFDIDRAGKNVGKESFIAYGVDAGNAWASPESDLEIHNDTYGSNSLFIKAKRFGSNCNNPVDPKNLIVETCYNQEKSKNQ